MTRQRLFSAVSTLAGLVFLWGNPAGAQTPKGTQPAGSAVSSTSPSTPPDAKPETQPAAPESTPPSPAPESTASSEASRLSAQAAYATGEAAFRAGNYAAAATQFERASKLDPTAQAQYWLAMSYDNADDIASAIQAYKAFLAHPDRAHAGADQIAHAKARLKELSATPAKLLLMVTPTNATVLSDDAPVPTGESLTLTPGAHRFTVAAPGFQTQEFELELSPGARLRESISLVRPPKPQLTEAEEEDDHTAAWITLGIAAGGIASGTIFGIKALNAKSDYDKTPTEQLADAVERDALISDMSFAAAITLGITGVVLLTTTEAQPETASTQPGHHWVVAPYASTSGGGAAAQWTF